MDHHTKRRTKPCLKSAPAFLRDFEEEYEKFESGNRSAGVRARKALMEIKRLADAGRKDIADRYKEPKPEGGSTQKKVE
jgi:hypothetical protein